MLVVDVFAVPVADVVAGNAVGGRNPEHLVIGSYERLYLVAYQPVGHCQLAERPATVVASVQAVAHRPYPQAAPHVFADAVDVAVADVSACQHLPVLAAVLQQPFGAEAIQARPCSYPDGSVMTLDDDLG